MENPTKSNKSQIRSYLIIWGIVFAYIFLDNIVSGPLAASLVGGIIINSAYFFTFYSIGYFVFPRFWNTSKFKLFVCLLICMIIYQVILYFCYMKIMPSLGGTSIYLKHSIWFLFSRKFFYFGLFSSAGIAFYFYRLSIQKISIQIKKENDLLIKELDFLKNQFNSHLTFNFLNHCYSRIYKKLPQTAESIELFSEVLRYTLQSKANNKVLIAEELANIENFIQLQKKLKPGLIINFYCVGNFENKYVFPQIFIYFIKYVLNDDNDRFNYNTDIEISIDNNSILTFKIKSIDLFFQYDEIKNYLDYYYSNNYRLKEIRTDRISEIEFILSDLSK